MSAKSNSIIFAMHYFVVATYYSTVSLVPRPHPRGEEKGSGYNTTSRPTLEGCNQHTIVSDHMPYMAYYQCHVDRIVELITLTVLWLVIPHARRLTHHVLRHSMATTLQICFLHLCLAQIICTGNSSDIFFSYPSHACDLTHWQMMNLTALWKGGLL